jgi:Family of unknown function (DUF6459)
MLGETALTAMRTLPAYEPPRGRPLRDWRSRRASPPLRVLPPAPPGPMWGEPPEMHQRLARLVAMLLEVLDGSRAVAQLKMLISDEVRSAATERAQEAAAAGIRYRLRKLHSCRPTERSIELTAVAATGVADRDRAIVVRLDRRTDGWICTVLEVVA